MTPIAREAPGVVLMKAIALETGRAKDKARLLQFVEAGVLESFKQLVARQQLTDKWQKFKQRFLT